MIPANRMAAVIAALTAPLLLFVGCEDGGLEAVGSPSLDGGVSDIPTDASLADGCDPITVYRDFDGDGHGDPDAVEVACDGVPEGFVTVANDCDDRCFECSPLSPELCDGLDNDCNGMPDDGLESESLAFFGDFDGDGFGDPGREVLACAAPQGFVAAGGDCDDRDPAVSPGATELCNAADDDCDGLVDQGLLETLGDAQLLDDANGAFLEIALDAWGGGWVAAWTADDRRVMYLPIPAGASVDPSRAQPIAAVENVLTGQAMPAVSVVRSDGEPWAVVAWVEGEVIYARGVRLTDGARTSVVTVSNTTDLSRVPLVIETTRDEVVIVWMVNADRKQVRARLFDPGAGTLGDEATIFVSDRVSPDNFGPSGIVLPSMPDTLFLGVTNRRIGDDVPVGYVHRVTLRPQLALQDEVGARLVPRHGRAADRVVLAPAGDPAETSSLLAFVSGGSRPDRVSDVFHVSANRGALTADFTGTSIEGLTLDATAAPGGSDLVVATEEDVGRTTLALVRQSPSGAAAPIANLATLLPDPWALLSRPGPTSAAALWAGRISDSDIAPGVWLQRYGCTP